MTIASVSWMVAALALLVQAWPHIDNVVQNQYKKGAAWEPRVDAILEVSRVASSGGPFLAIPSGSSFEPVDLAVNDLGFSAFGYFWGRLTGSPADRRVLMALNLVLLLAACAALFALFPPQARLAMAAVLLVVPVPVPEYRSPDPLATHGTLLLIGVTIAASLTRASPLWAHALLGAVLFFMHAIRSAYAFYAAAALLAVVVFEFLRTRDRALCGARACCSRAPSSSAFCGRCRSRRAPTTRAFPGRMRLEHTPSTSRFSRAGRRVAGA